MNFAYIGEKPDWIEHFNELLEKHPILFKNAEEASKALSALLSRQPTVPLFVFLESDTPESDRKKLMLLKKDRPDNLYLILVIQNISPQLVYEYISSGVNEIIDHSISREALQQILSVLPRLKRHENVEATPQIFHLPVWKRLFDILASATALVLLSPLLLLTALAIRAESRGPVIYTSQRVGSNYKIFGFLKFRSMYTDADKRLDEFKKHNQYQSIPEFSVPTYYHPSVEESEKTIFVGDDFRLTEEEFLSRRKKLKENNFIKIKDDPRITRIGRIIRKYSIDELPQLINILKGDMSVVGNRPLPLYEAELLTSDEYIERFMAPAGLTGLWQVEKRGTEGILSAEERKQLDIRYARKFSFWYDMKIICRTFTAFIQKENV